MTPEFIMLIFTALALVLTIIADVVAIAFFAGKLSTTQKFLSTMIDELKNNFNEKMTDLKDDLNNKINDNKKHTEEHIGRLEKKQDKHNNLIERMVVVEESTKSAHHRIDKYEGGSKC